MQEQIEPTYPYESLKQPRPLLVILSGPSGVGKDTVMAGLRDRGIQSSIHYRPIHTFSNFVGTGGDRHPLPLTDMIGGRELTLPLYPSMTEQQVELVCDTLHSLIGG